MRLDETHGLHRDRRGAGDGPEGRDVLPQCTEDGHRMHTPVREEAGVLGGNDRLHNPVVPVGDVGRAAVDIAGAKSDADDFPCGVAHHEPLWEDLRLRQRGRVAVPEHNKGDCDGNQ